MPQPIARRVATRRAVLGVVGTVLVVLVVAASGQLVVAYVVLAAFGFAWIALLRPEVGLAVLTFSMYTNLPAVLGNQHGFTSLSEGLLALLAAIALLRFLRRGELGRDLIAVALVLFVYLVSLASTAMIAPDPQLTLSGVIGTTKETVFVLLIVALLTDWRRLQWAVGGLVCGAVLVATITVLQYALGMYDNNFGGLANAQMHQIAGELDSWRVSGPLSDANYYAQMLLLALPFGFEALRHGKSPLFRLLGLAAGVLIVLAIFLTFSRGALVAIAVVLVALLWQRRAQMLGIGAVATLVLVAAVQYLPLGYFERVKAGVTDVTTIVTGEGYITDMAVAGRRSEMLVAVHLFRENPVLGVGYNQYESLYQDNARRHGLMARGSDRQAHSLYVEVLAERGLVGGMLFAALLMFAFGAVLRSVRRLGEAELSAPRGAARAVGFGLLGYMTAAIFLHDGYPHYFWLAFALAASLPQVTANLTSRVARNTRLTT
ncbi:MAG: O-antigen ligase family protein [Pseudorhodobacter sp.]|nr:O-antigen ligase family protein [Pseudorhodobacter sp.]